MNIRTILLIIIIIYLILLIKKKNKEKFTVDDDKIKSYIKDIYNTDVDSLRTVNKIIENMFQQNSLNFFCDLTCIGVRASGDFETPNLSFEEEFYVISKPYYVEKVEYSWMPQVEPVGWHCCRTY
jgi:hypothetical protein